MRRTGRKLDRWIIAMLALAWLLIQIVPRRQARLLPLPKQLCVTLAFLSGSA